MLSRPPRINKASDQWNSLSIEFFVATGRKPNGTHFAEWFEFVVEVAKTSLDLSAKQGTLASSTTKVSAIGREPSGFAAFV